MPRRRVTRAAHCDARDCLTPGVVALHIPPSRATTTVSRQKSSQSCYNAELIPVTWPQTSHLIGSNQIFNYDHDGISHWSRLTHIRFFKLNATVSDNGLSPGRCQSFSWTIPWILLIGPLGTNFSEISFEIKMYSLKKIRFKMSFAKCCPFPLGLNVLPIML